MALSFDRVEARSLVKLYGPTRALAGISVVFDSAEVTAVEGPNGSGKSTLLTLLALLARPTRGDVLFGTTLARGRLDELRRSIGVVAHAPLLYPDLTGRENLVLFAELYDLPDPRSRVAALVDRFELGNFLERPTRTYSRGQLQQVALARAVLHEPKLLLLDEPSTGLDAAALARLETVVRAEHRRGAIVILVTHDAEFATRVSTRRVRLHRGQLASTGAQDAA